MIKIVIITKTHIGPATPVPHFVDKEWNIIKKSKYYTLKNNLKEKLKEENIECDVQVNNHDDIDYIKREGVDLIIISPYLKRFLKDQIQDKDHYILSEREYLSGDIDNVVEFIKAAYVNL